MSTGAHNHQEPVIVDDEHLASAFRAYLHRVFGRPVAVVVRGFDDIPPEDAEIVASFAPMPAGLRETLASSGLELRFEGTDGPSNPAGASPVELYDRWDPGSVPAVPEGFRVLALITTFNELDIVEQLIKRLRQDQIEVHVVDNWSTDGTYEYLQRVAAQGEITLERFPLHEPSEHFELEKLLARVQELAHRSGADWVIHHDADEIREPPWQGISLRRALFAVDRWGFNCVDHTIVNFRPIDDSWQPGDDLWSSFSWFEFGDGPALFNQLKAWKPQPAMVEIASTGGHLAAFSGRRVFPYKFLTRHYPIRSQAHGERKILQERQARWSPTERAKGWHTHYDQFGEGSHFVWEPGQLIHVSDLEHRFLLQRLSGVGLPGNPWPGEGPPTPPVEAFSPSAYRATIQLTSPDASPIDSLSPFSPGEIRGLHAVVRNDGDATWLRAGRNGVGLSSRWFPPETLDTTASPPLFEGARSHPVSDIEPGEEFRQPFTVQAPQGPGRYLLTIDLVHEHIRWFGAGPALAIEVVGAEGATDRQSTAIDRGWEVPPDYPFDVKRYLNWQPPGHFYSPIPDHHEVFRQAERIFAVPDHLPGIDLREDAQVETYRRLVRLGKEVGLPAQATAGFRYHAENENYSIGDALMLAGFLRNLRPKRYLEVGSGFTTAATLDVRDRFLSGLTSVTAIEPYPALLRSLLRPGDDIEIIESPVQEVPLERFRALEAGDLLFIDDSHVVKTGSDAHFLIDHVLPVVAPGVVIHIHDIFWPFEYSKTWIDEGRVWTEAYLLHAFLAFNDAFQIEFFNNWFFRFRPHELGSHAPEMLDAAGGAIWLRRVK